MSEEEKRRFIEMLGDEAIEVAFTTTRGTQTFRFGNVFLIAEPADDEGKDNVTVLMRMRPGFALTVLAAIHRLLMSDAWESVRHALATAALITAGGDAMASETEDELPGGAVLVRYR